MWVNQITRTLRLSDWGLESYDMLYHSFIVRYRPVPSYTSAAKKDDFKAAAIFDEMEKTLKGVRDSIQYR